ncbi:hypothetical protein [Halomonas stenophila]|uniref:Metallothionein n=1 Tax=Halomonas stenophila TaxID=795312 RepID=A0A7W5EV31_9GAMM|nr:hypothetical protein [Halomonas stenophila]MBB3231345.1 hypothetical protein [Halomonas stenophila]
MGTCDTCGNGYDDSFQVIKDGTEYTFDCFECAIHKLAPECAACGIRIIGHGVQHGQALYCCGHCAHGAGASGIVDHA